MELELEHGRKLNAMARAAGQVFSLRKILLAWTDPEEFLRPKEIIERLDSQGIHISSSDLSIALREPALCGFLEKDANAPRYRPTSAVSEVREIVAEYGDFLFGFPVDFEKAAAALTKISATHLWALICVLQDGSEHSVSSLVDEVAALLPGERRLQQPEVTTRLQNLLGIEIVKVKPSGKFRYYSTSPKFEVFAEKSATLWHPLAEYFLAAYCC